MQFNNPLNVESLNGVIILIFFFFLQDSRRSHSDEVEARDQGADRNHDRVPAPQSSRRPRGARTEDSETARAQVGRRPGSSPARRRDLRRPGNGVRLDEGFGSVLRRRRLARKLQVA